MSQFGGKPVSVAAALLSPTANNVATGMFWLQMIYSTKMQILY